MLTLAEDLVAARERAGLLDEPKANGQPQSVSARLTVPDDAIFNFSNAAIEPNHSGDKRACSCCLPLIGCSTIKGGHVLLPAQRLQQRNPANAAQRWNLRAASTMR